MLDIALFKTKNGYDIELDNFDLKPVDNFKTAIEVLLFTDARADKTQVFLPQNRRGWNGDVVSPIEGRSFGSLLWLIKQERLTQETLNKAISFARKALQPFIDQGQALSIKISGEIIPTQGIKLKIDITVTPGNVESHYVELWELTQYAN